MDPFDASLHGGSLREKPDTITMVLHPCSRQEPPHPPWDILPSRVPQDQKEVTHETTMVGFGLRNDLIYYQVLCCRRMPRLAIFFLALSPMSRRKRKGNCPRERCGVLSLRCGKQPLLLRELPQNCVYGNQPPRTVSSRNFVWVTGEEKKQPVTMVLSTTLFGTHIIINE